MLMSLSRLPRLLLTGLVESPPKLKIAESHYTIIRNELFEIVFENTLLIGSKSLLIEAMATGPPGHMD
jgi:hypothetical protein